MQQGVKSALVLGPNSKKQQQKQAIVTRQIEYKQVANTNDYIGELSDEQKEAQFHRQHQQYIKMKMQRKKQLIRAKKQQFGTSSSQDNDDSSEEQIQEVKGMKKIQKKRSKQKIQSPNQTTYSVLFQLKKTTIQRQLHLFQKQFQINNKSFQYTKINRLSIFKTIINGKSTHKLKFGIDNDEGILSLNEKYQKDLLKIIDIFIYMFNKRMQKVQIKNGKRKGSCEEFGELKESAFIYDRIYKKSQVIGKWQQRYIIIKKQGLFSYRSLKEKPTMQISPSQTTELQTTFQSYKQNPIIKLHYNNTKTDFGLPPQTTYSWINHFANLIQ